MFAIYTPAGRAFRGPLEQLRRVDKSAQSGSTRRIDYLDEGLQNTVAGKANPYVVSKKSAEQYRSLLANENQREPVYHAYQVMTPTVKVLLADWQVQEALKQFYRWPYQVFPILDDRQALIGALSRRQLYEFIIDPSISGEKQTQRIGDCFLSGDSQVYCVDPVTDIRRITTLLVEQSLDALPVVEESGRIVGIVSRSDILRCASADPPLSLWC